MQNNARKYAVNLLSGWLTAIQQQNKAIRRKNKLINRLRREVEATKKQRDYFEQSHLMTLKEINGLRDEHKDKLTEANNAAEEVIDSLKIMLHEVGGCDSENDYHKGHDKAVDEMQLWMVENIPNFKEKLCTK